MILLGLLALAISPTPTISPPSPTPTTNDEIQKIREVVQQKVKEKLKQITNPSSSKKGIVGKIIQIDNSQITLESQNTTKTISIDDSTTYVDLNRNKSSWDKIKIGQDVLALVVSDNDDSKVYGKRIVITDTKSIANNKTVVIGKIVDISTTSPIFTLIPSKNKNTLFQIKTDTKSEIYSPQNQKINTSALKSGHKIIAILTPDTKMNKTYLAQKIIDFDFSPSPTSKP